MDYLKVIEEVTKNAGMDITSVQLEKLLEFKEVLQEENELVNLISRKSTCEDIWLRHILDSILFVRAAKLGCEAVLDFGSGGGLPGIPLKILFPEVKMYLLDSRQKKMASVKKILKKLDLPQCFTITSRIEELDKSWYNYFDIVISRSVRQEERFKEAMQRLLHKNGKVYLFKSQKMEDVELFDKYNIYDVSHPQVGTRKIIEVNM